MPHFSGKKRTGLSGARFLSCWFSGGFGSIENCATAPGGRWGQKNYVAFQDSWINALASGRQD